MSVVNIIACIPELERQLNELEQLASQSAVHRKKFEFSVNQFRRFLISFSSSVTDCVLSLPQVDAYKNTCDVLRELHQLLCQHQLHNWAHTTLDNPCSSVATTLCTLASRLQQHTSLLHEPSSKAFEVDSPHWLQYHLLDLRGIAASFRQYLENSSVEDDIVPLIKLRLQSVNTFLKEYENEQVPPGLRVFSPIPIHYQQWRLNLDDFEMVKEVGSGVSAVVFFGFDKRTKREVAIKRLKFKKLNGNKLHAFQREVSVLATASHPCLLGFVGATDTPPFCIITEWMAGDTLYHEIHKYKRLDATQRTIAAFDIARGMQFLHSKHIIHRDLKSLNVLFDSNQRAHICDFGFSRDMGKEDLYTQNIGTPHWMAPELLTSSSSYNSKIDVYAYGIVLWELVSGQLPFAGLESTQIIAQVLMNDSRPMIPSNTNSFMADLIKQCWDRNPDNRPSFDEIVRRFQTGPVLLNGADHDIVREYIEEMVGCEGSAQVELENKLKSAHEDEEALTELFELLEQGNIPNDLIPKLWAVIEKNPNASSQTMGRAASHFLNTSVRAKAAALLRRLPPGSVPQKSVIAAVELIPSGSEEYDADISVVACKNKAADVCVVYCMNSTHLKLALEIVAQQGAAPTLRAAVADRCVMSLSSHDSNLVCSALRCLIGIGEAKRITINTIKTYLISDCPVLVNTSYAAAAGMAMAGIQLPVEVIEHILEKSQTNPLALTALVSSCKCLQSALQIVNRIAYVTQIDLDTAMRVLLLTSQHRDLLPAVMVAMKRIDFSKGTPLIKEAYQHLQSIVSTQ